MTRFIASATSTVDFPLHLAPATPLTGGHSTVDTVTGIVEYWRSQAPSTVINAVADDGTVTVLSDETLVELITAPFLPVGQLHMLRFIQSLSGGDPDFSDLTDDAKSLLDLMFVDIDTDQPLILNNLLLSRVISPVTPAPAANVRYSVNQDMRGPLREYVSAWHTAHLTSRASARVSTDYPGESQNHLDLFFLGSWALYAPTALGLVVADDTVYSALITRIVDAATALHNAGDMPDNEFEKAEMLGDTDIIDPTEGITNIVLRTTVESVGPENSFARLVGREITRFVNEQRVDAEKNNMPYPCAVLGYDLPEWMNPSVVVINNANEISDMKLREINNRYIEISRYSNASPKIVDPRKLTTLNNMDSALRKIARDVATAKKRPDSVAVARINAKTNFPDRKPQLKVVVNDIAAVSKKMGDVTVSSNPYKVQRPTHTKSSRRHPHDPNYAGHYATKQYRPDYHLFPDRSYSIETEHYESSVLVILMLAQKFDVDVYYNSFSDVISKEYKLPLKGKSVAQMKQIIHNVPNVDGGTDFHQVYDYINQHPETHNRFCLMPTDFGWSPEWDGYPHNHPGNLFYLPSFHQSSNHGWERVTNEAAEFINSMTRVVPDMSRRILGMGLHY